MKESVGWRSWRPVDRGWSPAFPPLSSLWLMAPALLNSSFVVSPVLSHNPNTHPDCGRLAQHRMLQPLCASPTCHPSHIPTSLLAHRDLSMMTWEWWADSTLILSRAADLCQRSVNYGWTNPRRLLSARTTESAGKRHRVDVRNVSKPPVISPSSELIFAPLPFATLNDGLHKPHSRFTDPFLLDHIIKNMTPAVFGSAFMSEPCI